LVHTNLEATREYERENGPYLPERLEIESLQSDLPDATFSVTQVTFFSVEIDKTQKRLPRWVNGKDILSTSVIVSISGESRSRSRIRLPYSYVYEAIVPFPTLPSASHNQDDHFVKLLEDEGLLSGREGLLNNYYHVGSEIEIVVAGRNFGVEAAYFCQQNGINGVCGHAVTRMALWNIASFPQTITNADINRIVRKLQGRRVGFQRTSFDIAALEAVCKEYGVRIVSYDCALPDISPYEYAYLLVESGIPAIIAFVTECEPNGKEMLHVLPVIGHTMNTDEWYPAALDRYKNLSRQGLRGGPHPDHLSSVEWVPHLIVHDDLLGPYLCLDSCAFPTVLHRNEQQIPGRVKTVIGLLDKTQDVSEHPFVVQDVAAGFFWGMLPQVLEKVQGPWGKRLREMEWSPTQVVLRTQIITKDHYLEHLKAATDHEGRESGLSQADERLLKTQLDPIMWMTEITIPNLYVVNKRKLGEILLPLRLDGRQVKARSKGHGPAPILSRLVNHALLYGKRSVDLEFRSHIRLYRRVSIDVEF
jgi:hypothetical protein